MNRFVTCALSAFLLVSGLLANAALAADAKFNISGTWNLAVDAGGQQGTPTFEFKQDGNKLTGKYKGQFGEAEVKGNMDGDKIEFGFELQGLQVAYKGTVESKDAMKGEVNYGDMANGTWTGKKAASAINVTGTWILEVVAQGNTSTPEFTFKQEGSELTGKYKGQFGEADVKGKIQDNKIEFSLEAQNLRLAYTGEVENDTMKGTLNVADMINGTWTGKRKPAEPGSN